MMSMNRREFIRNTALFSALGFAPAFLTRTVAAATVDAAPAFRDDRILVVVQLGGGNDGLNTVVPWNDDAYYRARPKLGLGKNRLLRINDDVALNDALAPMKALYDDGLLGIVQGVGYPNPDRSHFRSMEIWHTASDSDEFLGHGWLGRYFDNYCAGCPPEVGMAIDAERPQAFTGVTGAGISTTDPARFGWQPGPGPATEARFHAMNPGAAEEETTLDFLRHTNVGAILSTESVRRAAEKGKVGRQLRPGRGTDQLDAVAGLIRGGLGTRIYYVSTGGFDTHANQTNQHERLLGQVAEALQRFQQTLEADGTADRVVTLAFSEFGRRVQENGTGGTDHGTAAPLFMMGRGIQPGLHGAMPSLTALDHGDLVHAVDFRQVYATLLRNWFAVDADPVLGKPFETLPLLRA
jgi:uncharacterized protein (DUF1501 family)